MTVGRWTSSTHFLRNVKSALTTLLYLNFIWTLKSSLPNHSPFVMISRVGFFMQVAQFSTIMQRRMTLLKTTSTWYILEVIWIKIRFPVCMSSNYSCSYLSYQTFLFTFSKWEAGIFVLPLFYCILVEFDIILGYVIYRYKLSIWYWHLKLYTHYEFFACGLIPIKMNKLYI